MTRRRRTGRYRSQMPTDLLERERVARIDHDRKSRHTNLELQARMRDTQNVRLALDTPSAHERDVIEEARKRPKTFDEINSNRAGGVDR